MNTTRITIEELLAELEQAESANAPDGRTSREWAEEWGVNMHKARDLVRAAITAGKMTPANVRRKDVMRPGYFCSTTVYTWTGGNRGKA
jgi:hypothetical protein